MEIKKENISMCDSCPNFGHVCRETSTGSDDCLRTLFSTIMKVSCIREDCVFFQSNYCTKRNDLRIGTDGVCKTFVENTNISSLIVECRCDPFSVEQPVVLFLRGQTRGHEEKLAELGFTFSAKPKTGMFVFHKDQYPISVWHLRCSFEEKELLFEILDVLGLTIENYITKSEITTWETTIFRASRTESQLMEEALSLTPPRKPRVLQGATWWNQKIYGTNKRFVFLDGEKVPLSEREVEALEKYLSELLAYDKHKFLLAI